MTEVEDKLITYLLDRVSKGKVFFKSKYIAKEIGASQQQVGTTIANIIKNQKAPGIDIKPYSTAISTTWRIVIKTG